jgi:hypothetical protein
MIVAVDSMQQQPEAGMQTTDRFEEVPCYDRCTWSYLGTPIMDCISYDLILSYV